MASELLPQNRPVVLSSATTGLYRTVFPFSSAVIGLAFLALAAGTRDSTFVFAAVGALALAAFCHFAFRGLSHVVLNGDTLYVARKRGTYPIPLSQVAEIEARSGSQPRIGYVYFKTMVKDVGPYVMFIPVGFNLWGRNPLIEAVNARAAGCAELAGRSARTEKPHDRPRRDA